MGGAERAPPDRAGREQVGCGELGWRSGVDEPTEALAAAVAARHSPARDRRPGEVEALLLPHRERIEAWLKPEFRQKRGGPNLPSHTLSGSRHPVSGSAWCPDPTTIGHRHDASGLRKGFARRVLVRLRRENSRSALVGSIDIPLPQIFIEQSKSFRRGGAGQWGNSEAARNSTGKAGGFTG
jgi:hypothetical protein